GQGGSVEALPHGLELGHGLLDDPLETVFIGGGTPTFTEAAALESLLAALPPCDELTIEANPETVTPELAALIRDGGAGRVSLGVQSFRPQLLASLYLPPYPTSPTPAYALHPHPRSH